MSRLRKFRHMTFYTKPSSAEFARGSRQEHLPPHIELFDKNKFVLKVEIPKRFPKTIEDILTEPQTSKKDRRDILNWFLNVEYDKTLREAITGYELAIRFWNRDNEKYEIEFSYGSKGLVVIEDWPS